MLDTIRGDQLLKAVTTSPWAILPEKLAAIVAVIGRRVAGEQLSEAEIQASMGAAVTRERRQLGRTAILPLYGVIMPRANMLTRYSGGTSAQQFGIKFNEALADPGVRSIVLDVDSPGGSTAGVEELAATILAARGRKRVVAVANHLMASAAYWIASGADEIVATPSADVGSIGVYAVHVDHSEANVKEGVKPTYISAGKFKTEGNPDEPLSDAAKGQFQQRVDEVYSVFVLDVARGRNTRISVVKSKYGEGRVLGARAAVAAGLADRIGTLESVLAQLG